MLKKRPLPRAANALRAFCDFASPTSKDLAFEPNALSQKKLENNERLVRLRNLDMVKDFLSIHSSYSPSDLKNALSELLVLAKEIAGSHSTSSYIESSIVYLIEMFRDCDMIGKRHTQELRQMFGDYPIKSVNRAFTIIRGLVDSLDGDIQESFVKDGFPPPDEGLLEESFGAKIKFISRSQLNDVYCSIPLHKLPERNKDAFEGFSFKFVPSQNEIETQPPPVQVAQPRRTHKIFDQQWLEEALERTLNSANISYLEMSLTVLNLLQSTKSNEELQNELFDLLGFERIDLIQEVLQHREEIAFPRVIEPQSKEASNRKPSYMNQVVIQSETEKLLSKQIRKDEKRIHREKKFQEEDTSGINPQWFKRQREEALIAAQNTPIFHHAEPVILETSIYPNVYDLYTQTKMSASLVSGKKLVLPENHKRTNNSIFEEINIPSTESVLNKMDVRRVPISELDEIGRIAFHGTETLNCIQSMVFNTAYHSNHNLLVCAPTGAGKTNVAMLTIVHELRNNIVDGVLQKAKFKIVYVAPMKALASEMVRNFGTRLKGLGIQVKELTGDMQLTKTEIAQTQMLVTTPEKWDVVTRKSNGDTALSQIVKLLILDEVHLLDGDRGPVLEALVARTLRQVESSQSMIRIVGLSATLPNYIDVARFLKVNPMLGLFFFDDRFRPVPLSPTFIGVKAHNPMQSSRDMDEICYRKVSKLVQNDHQVMVFVHARNATVKTATILKDLALQNEELQFFTELQRSSEYGRARSNVLKSRNKQLKELFEHGFAIHHAGMLRSDRNLVEKYFRDGLIKVLVCTSTLAWGVNLPARAVIIKGTELYDSKQGKFVDLGVLDVMQIFGRAGRPQYDNRGEGTIITSHDKLSHYLSLLTRQHQIESKFESKIADNLNAEIALGTVTNIEDGIQWLGYTYLQVRMLRNPLAYGIKAAKLQEDPQLYNHKKEIIEVAARKLHKAHMIRFDANHGYLHITDMGRTASHFYINTETIIRFNETFKSKGNFLHDSEIFRIISQAEEFDQIKVRDEEEVELDHLLHECYLDVPLGHTNPEGKVNLLLQSYLSKLPIEGFSLVSDMTYVAQNATRITRALFEMCLRKNQALLTAALLRVSIMMEKRLWSSTPPACYSPLYQFKELGPEVLQKIDRSRIRVDDMFEMTAEEIGERTRCFRERHTIKQCVDSIPKLLIEPVVQPITDTILRITLNIQPDFKWSDKHNGSGSETFWIWVCDPDTDVIYHSEYFTLPRKQVIHPELQPLVFVIPLPRDQMPSQYLVRVMSDRWLGSDREFSMPFHHLILPQHKQPHTDLLNLVPLPVKALKNKKFENLYKFDFFNPIQTQIFHTLYHTDHNVLLGAPTGSGKTIAAEIAMFRVFNEYPGTKVVYIAPLKALVRERIEDWKVRFQQGLKKNVVELTGDVTPDASAIARADIIVTTPEKWDGVSRSWQTRNYVKAVSLIAIDEIHLLGEDRGPVLEVIVSRTNFISAHTERKLRVIGLSTALANAVDIGNWLGIKEVGLYNFRSSVRPVQLEIHVSGYHGKHYCPRMALMNKPTYQAIMTHSPQKPSLIFVSSRRQTRLTALDLIAFLVCESEPRQWVHMSDQELDNVVALCRDQNLKLSLAFGIGLHHAGLHERDRKLVEELFLNQKIQVLIATATLAWGINLPAHLVVIKGTEYFDGKIQRYVDFPITDVMQMCGRAGRPQFDTTGVAVVLVHDVKKNFYKKFLHDPFPVESSLIGVLPEHINAEVVAGTIASKQQCLDYITWTYFFRRLLQNPAYYQLESIDSININQYLSGLINQCLGVLSNAGCLSVDDDDRTVLPTVLGKIASYYYLSHKTILIFTQKLHKGACIEEILQILCDTNEYAELPVRHNEDSLNQELSKKCRVAVDQLSFDSPHTKANLLLQAHFSHLQLPCTDYYTDLKSVLDQAIRIIQAIIDVSADKGWLSPTLLAMTLLQMILQARWHNDSSLLTLPYIEKEHLDQFYFHLSGNTEKQFVDCLPKLIYSATKHSGAFEESMRNIFIDEGEITEISTTLKTLPVIRVRASIRGWWDESNKEESRSLDISRTRGARPDSAWLPVHADQEYVLSVHLERVSKHRRETTAIAPRFPKQKSEGWFLVLGNPENKELIAMKRIPFISKPVTHQLMFYTPEKIPEGARVKFNVYLVSDSYLGLDQEYDICINVMEPSLRAQANTEMDLDSDTSDSEED